MSNQQQQQKQKQKQKEQPKGNKRARGNNWTFEEDTQLCKSWVEVSTNPIKGNDQKSPDFWKAVEEDFAINFVKVYKIPVTERAENSHQNRFTTIASAVNKFCGFFDTCIRGPAPSGSDPSDAVYNTTENYLTYVKTDMTFLKQKVIRATEMYKASETKDKKGFTFLHCWKVLRMSEKWKSRAEATQFKVKAKAKRVAMSVLVEDDAQVQARPMGRKRAKAMTKNSDDQDEEIRNTLKEFVEVTNRKIDFAEEEKRFFRDQSYLMMDLSTISFGPYRDYVQEKQLSILEGLKAADLARAESRRRSIIETIDDDQHSLVDEDGPMLVEDEEPVLVEDEESVLVEDD